jgi:transcription elongation factor GreA
MDRAPITKEGLQLLVEELSHLKRVERPDVIFAIKVAREHGDLKENAEYHAARDKQGMIEAKIRDLEGKTSTAEVIDMNEIPDGVVAFGVTVEIEDLDTEEVKKFRIVGPYEADINRGLVSSTAPLARALLGKVCGDDVTFQAPGGTKEYEILSISK